MFCKNLCDKVSKIKNWRCTFYSFFRALRCGVLCFFCQCIFHGENRKKTAFFAFFKKSQNRWFCFAIFSMKNASTEKTEYTTTKSTEKLRRWQCQIFHFRNFVTEIFAKHFQRFSIFWLHSTPRMLRKWTFVR